MRSTDCSAASATLVGYGYMGRQYLQAMTALNIGTIRVCSRSEKSVEAVPADARITTTAGGVERLGRRAREGELAIVATSTETLLDVSQRLIALGFRKLLIEKPVSLNARDINHLSDAVDRAQGMAVCAYNRLAYPSFIEALGRTAAEGGATSFVYDMTEMVRADWTERFPSSELRRWGIANSMHVMSMAHRLGGFPTRWSCYHAGGREWHPSGSVFVGSGLTEVGTPFSYHADWESKRRWAVEVNTAESCYRLCPLERLFRKTKGTADFEEVPVESAWPDIKAGIVEQVAAMLNPQVASLIPTMTLAETARLTRFAEDVFGYLPCEALEPR